MNKRCPHCKNDYPATTEFYYKQKSTKDGLTSWCKICMKTRQIEYNHLNKEKQSEYFKQYYQEYKDNWQPYRDKFISQNLERRKDLYLEWQRNNKDKIRKFQHNRRAYKKYLQNNLDDLDIMIINRKFNYRCPITYSTEYEFEHFIPLSWGHGGSYIGNVYLLDKSLNHSKFDKNPFAWIKEYGFDEVHLERWNRLIRWLAWCNKLNVDEFIDYVNWCDCNRRTIEELSKTKQISSIVLWKTSVSINQM